MGCNSHLLSPFALYLGRLDYKFLSPGPRPVFHVGVQVLNFPLWPLPSWLSAPEVRPVIPAPLFICLFLFWKGPWRLNYGPEVTQ